MERLLAGLGPYSAHNCPLRGILTHQPNEPPLTATEIQSPQEILLKSPTREMNLRALRVEQSTKISVTSKAKFGP